MSRAGGGRKVRAGSIVVLLALLGAGLVVGPSAAPAGAAATFTVQPSVRQVAVTHAAPGTAITLLDDGSEVAAGTTDTAGSFLFRGVEPGPGYSVEQLGEESDPVTVMDASPPPQSLYDGQTLGNGYGYIETRDGTTLSVNVTLPGAVGDGPYPVVFEYSGYEPSNPNVDGLSPTGLAAVASGYAWVGVNMRGTGCSGGAFDYFEELHGLDGYDVIETIATQEWADPTAIAMIGVSYPGISQLFVAPTRPPHLTAITPMSVIADVYRSTLYPGGILNTGFATEWAQGRDDAAQPSASGWSRDRIEAGDTVCEENQLLRLQFNEIIPQLDPNRFYSAERFDYLAPRTMVDDIDIPVLLGGTFQDEQTGGHWPTMIPAFTSADPLKVIMTNGHHADPLVPMAAVRLLEFFDFYLKREVPRANWLLYLAAPTAFGQVFGEDDIYLTASRWDGYTDYAAALAAYEAEPMVTVLWEDGAAGADGSACGGQAIPGFPSATPAPCPGRYPYPSAVSTHAAWPPPETSAWVQHLGPDGQLLDGPTGLDGDEPRAWTSYEYAPEEEPQRTFAGGNSEIFRVDATFDWQQPTDERRTSFLTEPMTEEVRLLGSGSADLWIRSTAPNVDLEVTLSEVTPAGDEVYIQSGWLRASHRALAPGSTQLLPQHSHEEADALPLSATDASLARVEIFPFAHVLRPGSQLRLTVDAPGGNRPFWEFGSVDAPDGTQVEIAMSDVQPSQLVLPVIGGDAPNELPPCGWLRGQPCRDFAVPRIPTGVTATAEGTTVEVAWTAPAGGTPTGYEVELLSTGQTATVGAGVTTTSFADLAPGEHRAQVRALFSSDQSPWSSPSLPAVVASPDPTFVDVPESHPFYEDIEWMAAEGISTGFQPGPEYRPAQPVTRQAMSAFLHRLAGDEAPVGCIQAFADVPTSHPFFEDVCWMDQEGISTGFLDGTYRPAEVVTRQAMSAFLHRLAGDDPVTLPGSPTFSDVAASHPFYEDIEWMAAEDISTGFQPGPEYRPAQPVTRQAMSAFLHRLAALL